MNNDGMNLTMPVAPTGGYGGGMFGGGFGGDGWWIILLFLIWGNNGWGGGGMNGGVGSEVQRGFDHSATISKLDGITTGLCDSTYALNNAITTGFYGVDRGLCDLGSRIDNCCCTTQRSIDQVRYDMAREACDTRHAITDSTRTILDFLTSDKISTLTAENQALKFQASQSNQNAYLTATIDASNAELIRRLGRDPVAAYMVPNPYASCGVSYGCGCGC